MNHQQTVPLTKKVSLAILALLLVPQLYGQIVSGTTIDGATKELIPFVNIGVKGTPLGTVSDSFGGYSFDVSNCQEGDTISVSHLGYEDQHWPYQEFQNTNKIKLVKSVVHLPALEVKPFKKHKRIGKRTTTQKYVVGFSREVVGTEIGSLIKLKKRSRIQSITLSVVECLGDSIPFRLNIYTTDFASFPAENFLLEPLYFHLSKKDSHNELTIDLEHLNVVVEEDFVIGVELIDEKVKNRVNFSALLFTGKSFVRKGSQGQWEKRPFGIGFSVQVLRE